MAKVDLAHVQAVIHERLESLDKTQTWLDTKIAESRGRPSSTLVKDILSGKSQNPTLASLTKISDVLGIEVDEFFGGKVPVVGYVGAGGQVLFEDCHEKGGALYHANKLPDLPGGMIGLEVRGDSMLPLFRDGSVVYIKRKQDGVDSEALNEWAVARLDDGRVLLKQVRRGSQPGHFDLLSLNADPIENVLLEWAPPVLGWVTRAGR